MNVRLPRHRPASLRRIVPMLMLFALAAGLLFAVVSRPSSTTPSASKAKGATQVSLRRVAPAPEPRKQRTRNERPAAPESKV
ncbi:MAG: hypothetical protein ABW190_13145 [Rhizobacter sp.]